MTVQVGDQEDGSPQQLMDEVRHLVKQVRLLNQRLTRQYPNREEVRRQGRRRALQFLGFGVVLIILAQLATITTVSYCFLNPAPGAGPRPACRAIPGYGHAIDESNARLARFELLLSQIDINRQQVKLLKTENQEQTLRLRRLEAQVGR